MSPPSQTPPRRAEILSALADGELDARDTQVACSLWRDDQQAQTQWADYQLIGDVLRSEDLARSPRHDSALFAAIQAQLALQPVVLAPQALTAPQDLPHLTRPSNKRRSWAALSAVAAGVLAVAGGWSLMRVPLPSESGALMAQQSAAPVVVAPTPAAAAESVGFVGPVVRDADLDRYLAAHKQFSSASVLGVASGSVRQVVLDSSGR
jgi:sigma-E factor negative regulatory protein RseA